MKYFVTGATGFIGGVLARQLRDAGHEVVALVRDPERAAELATLGVTLAQGDITDKESMLAPMTGVDGVFHVAGWYQLGAQGAEKERGYAVNVEGTRNVLELMLELAIPKGVYTSTLAINSDTRGELVNEGYHFDGAHLSEYERTKWLAHCEVAEPMIRAGLPLVILMPGVVYGPDDTSLVGVTFRDFLRRRNLIVSTVTFCWAHVEDVARAHVAAMEKGRVGETYIIAGPVHRLDEALDIATEITGIPAGSLVLPGTMIKGLAAIVGLLEKVLPIPPGYRSETLRSGAGVTYIADNSKARRELGFNPRPLREGLAETLAHEQAALGLK